MPIYEFKCEDERSPYFEKPKEIFMSMAEYRATKNKLKCEVTGKPLVRIISSFGFILKGGGWSSWGR